jgi:hypothetical protein
MQSAPELPFGDPYIHDRFAPSIPTLMQFVGPPSAVGRQLLPHCTNSGARHTGDYFKPGQGKPLGAYGRSGLTADSSNCDHMGFVFSWKEMVAWAPPAGLLPTSNCALCPSAIALTIVRPRPVPLAPCPLSLSLRQNMSNEASCT